MQKKHQNIQGLNSENLRTFEAQPIFNGSYKKTVFGHNWLFLSYLVIFGH